MDQRELFKRTAVGASKAILLTLLTGAAIISPGGTAVGLKILNSLFEDKEFDDYSHEQVRNAIKYLRRKKLIEIQSQYQKQVFGLTKLGWLRVRRLMKSFGIQKPSSWDGKWRLVIFDIPDSKKDTADVFRQQLKRLGLANLQKSIWVHPYECRDQVFYLAGNMFIKPYVRYVLAEEVTGGKDLQKRFGI